jgi:hypothetical protein
MEKASGDFRSYHPKYGRRTTTIVDMTRNRYSTPGTSHENGPPCRGVRSAIVIRTEYCMNPRFLVSSGAPTERVVMTGKIPGVKNAVVSKVKCLSA